MSQITVFDRTAAPQAPSPNYVTLFVKNGDLWAIDEFAVEYQLSYSSVIAISDVAAAERVVYHTVTAGEESATSLTLPSTPLVPSKVSVTCVGGCAQVYAVDFTVTGTTLSWLGLGLADFLGENDILLIRYIEGT